MRKYGLFRGRFQPFHRGHLETCREILSKHSVIVIGIVVVKYDITTSDIPTWVGEAAKASIVTSFQRKSNPFSYIQVYEMIEGSLIEDGVDPSRLVLVPHFSPMVYPEDMEFLFMPPQNETILYIPTLGDHNVFGIEMYRKRGWIVEPKTKEASKYSGTNVREKLRQGENAAEILTPFVTNYLEKNDVNLGEE